MMTNKKSYFLNEIHHVNDNNVLIEDPWPRRKNCNTIHCVQRDIDGLAQDCSNSIANALWILQSSIKPSIYCQVTSSRLSDENMHL